MSLPRISIVIPSYNQGRYLEETLLSVINQSYPNLELFVIDGSSTDNSVSVIRKYEQHIQWWVSEKDSGQSEALNKGLKRATGQIINWLGSDDLLIPGALHEIAGIFSSQPRDVGLIHGGTTLFKDGKIIRDDWGISDHSAERYFAGIAFSQPSAFFLKDYFDLAGGQLNESLHYGMDYDLYSRLACTCRFIAVKNIFSKYRLHENSKSVAEEYRFSDDWSRVFINLCKNLQWDELLSELKTPGVVNEELFSFFYPFSFRPNEMIIKKLPKQKILFYHFCILLRSYYHTGNRKKARRLAHYIKKKYCREWLVSEKYIPEILMRVKIPEPLLGLMLGIKNMNKNMLTGK